MNREVVALDQEPQTRRLLRGPLGHVALGHLGHGSARGADHVMVVAPATEPVDDLSARTRDRIHRSTLHQERHRALGGAFSEPGQATAPARQQESQGQTVPGIAQGVQDRLSLRRASQAVGAQTAPHGLGSRCSHGVR